ncbi:MAG: hypothetical protein NVS3B20_13640 [Polyangiales bacterium]
MVALFAYGCVGDYDVVRVNDGRAQSGRYVSSEAYAASLAAAIAEEHADFGHATEALRVALEYDHDAPELMTRLGSALCHLGKTAEAMSAFADAITADSARERAYTARAACRLRSSATRRDQLEARADLNTAVFADPEAIEPALLLVDLDLNDGAVAQARARIEEQVVLHPTSAVAFRVLAEVAARQNDASRAVTAAMRAGAYDTVEGVRARELVSASADQTGIEAYGLAMRGTQSALPTLDAAASDPACAARLRSLTAIGAIGALGFGNDGVVAIAAEGVRASCPQLDAESTMIELTSAWTPERSAILEKRALDAPSARARRWGARMHLRFLTTDQLLEAAVLPGAEDRETLALHLAVDALRHARSSASDATVWKLATSAHDLAPAEPTVARVVAEVARRTDRPIGQPFQRTACALARTTVEKAACRGAASR